MICNLLTTQNSNESSELSWKVLQFVYTKLEAAIGILPTHPWVAQLRELLNNAVTAVLTRATSLPAEDAKEFMTKYSCFAKILYKSQY